MEEKASTDLNVAGGCTNDLTWSNSDVSFLTVENSSDLLHRHGSARSDKFTGWTDEKHNLYLEYLEALFVKQLQRSTGLLAWCSELKRCGSTSSQKLPAKTCNSSKQFSVLQDGCWQKISFGKKKPLSKFSADSNTGIKNPSLCHYRCPGKSCNSADPQEYYLCCGEEIHLQGMGTSPHGLATGSTQLTVDQCPAGSITEVSDQNFVDGDKEEKLNNLSRSKRLKTAVEDASSQDQLHLAEISSGREEQVCQEWVPENVGSFVCHQSDMKYLLQSVKM